MKNKSISNNNYLDRIPCRAEHLEWETDESGKVTLAVENTGIMNRIAQKLFKKPEMSYIHLDEVGSFVWPTLDGQITVGEIADKVKDQFGEKADPLYERLVQYMYTLERYGFITWKNE